MTFSTIRSTLEGAPLRYTRFKVSLKLNHSSELYPCQLLSTDFIVEVF